MNTIDFSRFHLSKGPKITTEIPGERSRALIDIQKEIEGSIVSYPKSIPIAIRRAKGAVIEDEDGNLFLDFFSCAGVLNLGHCNEEVLEYATAQQKELIHALDFPTRNKMEAIQNILASLPEELADEYKVSFVAPTGSDAIEAAIKLAKIKTGRDTVIAFTGGYHGMTSGALAVTSDVDFRKKFSTLLPNIHFVPYSYCYRCPFKKTSSDCNLDCVNYLRNVLEDSHSGVPKPAAILLESIQGEGGNIVPRDGFLEEIINVAHEHGVLVIFDEIQCGFFRSGEFLSFMHSNAAPDIITISKGLGGVGFPVAAVVYRKEVEAWTTADHIGTFRGNQVSLAAANGAFAFARKYNIRRHVREISEYFFGQLEDLKNSYDNIGDLRGKGLMIGIEFVTDRKTKKPFPEFLKTLRDNCVSRGLIFEIGGHFSNVARLMPPLIVTHDIVDSAMVVLKQSLDATVAALNERSEKKAVKEIEY